MQMGRSFRQSERRRQSPRSPYGAPHALPRQLTTSAHRAEPRVPAREQPRTKQLFSWSSFLLIQSAHQTTTRVKRVDDIRTFNGYDAPLPTSFHQVDDFRKVKGRTVLENDQSSDRRSTKDLPGPAF